MPDCIRTRKQIFEVSGNRRQDCADQQRHQHEEADAEDHRERNHALFKEVSPEMARLRLHTPNAIERRLQFTEHTRRADEQDDDARDTCSDAVLGRPNRVNGAGDRGRRILSDQARDLVMNVGQAVALVKQTDNAQGDNQ